jgi:hypothetical protein
LGDAILIIHAAMLNPPGCQEDQRMVLAAVAAVLIGLIVGFLDLLLFWYFLTGLLDGRFRQITFTSFLGLMLGSTIASAPIGHLVLSSQLWTWYVVE